MTTTERDPNNLEPNEPGAKLDDGKILAGCLGDISLALKEVARVFTFGVNKYSRGGWQHVENGIQRYNDAAWRHKLEDGGSIAPDSGLLHLAHEAWNVLAELELRLRETPQEEDSPNDYNWMVQAAQELHKNISTPTPPMRQFNAASPLKAVAPRYEPKINEVFEVNKTRVKCISFSFKFGEPPTASCSQCHFAVAIDADSILCPALEFVTLSCRAVARQDETNVIFVEVKPE
jgi:hypothetical protein